jgi:hypothetical protein
VVGIAMDERQRDQHHAGYRESNLACAHGHLVIGAATAARPAG